MPAYEDPEYLDTRSRTGFFRGVTDPPDELPSQSVHPV